MADAHQSQCVLCKIGVGMEEGRTHAAVADDYGIAETSVRRHRKYLTRQKETTHFTADDLFERYNVDAGMMSVRGMTVKDESGSWVRLVPNDSPQMVKDELLEELFREPISMPTWETSPHAAFLSMADMQIGKAMERGGGTPETLACVRAAVAKFVAKVKRERPETAVLVDGGDSFENIFNTHKQASTNDLAVPEQIREARRIFAWAIRQVAPYVRRLIFLTVPSNHTEARSAIGVPIGTSDADYGLDINCALEEIFEERPGFEHVEFLRPEPMDDTAVVTVANTKVAVNHGYHSKGIHKHGEWWAKMDHGRRTGWDADILLMAHYHTFGLSQSGDGRWIISSTSPDPGSEWFSKMSGQSSKRGLTSFNVRDGQWYDVAIL